MARDLKEAVKMFEAIKDDLPNFYDDVLKNVARHFLSSVIRLTPVEENYTYDMGGASVSVRGGALRRGWIGQVEPGGTPSTSEIDNYVRSLRTGGYRVTLSNSVSYAMYVDEGHRQHVGQFVPAIKAEGADTWGARLKKPWVNGLFFKEKAEHEIEPKLPLIYDQTLKEYYAKWNKLS